MAGISYSGHCSRSCIILQVSMGKLRSEERPKKYIIHPRPELNRASALVLEPSSIQDERTRCVWYDSRGIRLHEGFQFVPTLDLVGQSLHIIVWPGNRAQPVASIYGLSRYRSTPLWLKIFLRLSCTRRRKTKSKTFEVRGVRSNATDTGESLLMINRKTEVQSEAENSLESLALGGAFDSQS